MSSPAPTDCTRECCQPKTFATKRSHAAYVNNLRRWHPGAPETLAAERALTVARITDAYREITSSSSPLWPEDVEALMALFSTSTPVEQ